MAEEQRLTQRQKQERKIRQEARRRRKRRRTLLGLFVLLLIVAVFVIIRSCNGSLGHNTDFGVDELDDASKAESTDDEAYSGDPVCTISFVGEIAPSDQQVEAAKQRDGTYDFTQPFLEISDLLSSSDYLVGTLDTGIVSDTEYTGKAYTAPFELAGDFSKLGFRLVSTAGTYALNNGLDGLVRTLDYLDEAKLKAVGTYASQEQRDTDSGVVMKKIHGIEFAFLGYTKGTDAVKMPDGHEYCLNTLYADYSDYWTDTRRTQIQSDIQAAKDAGAEVIVALVHWGSEYSRPTSTPQTDMAKLLLNDGVDVIIGCHSHLVGQMGYETVTLDNDQEKQTFVAYSLGDFYTDPTETDAQESLVLNLTFSKDTDGQVTITDANYVPLYLQITGSGSNRTYQMRNVYNAIASFARGEMEAVDDETYNALLGTIDDLHRYAGEAYDAGPDSADSRVVKQALEDGPVTDDS